MFKFVTQSPKLSPSSRKKTDHRSQLVTKPLSKELNQHGTGLIKEAKYDRKKKVASEKQVKTKIVHSKEKSCGTSNLSKGCAVHQSLNNKSTSGCLNTTGQVSLVWSCGCTVGTGTHHLTESHRQIVTERKGCGGNKIGIEARQNILLHKNMSKNMYTDKYKSYEMNHENWDCNTEVRDYCEEIGLHISETPELYSDSDESSGESVDSSLSLPIISCLPPSHAVRVPASKPVYTSQQRLPDSFMPICGEIFEHGPLFLTAETETPTSEVISNERSLSCGIVSETSCDTLRDKNHNFQQSINNNTPKQLNGNNVKCIGNQQSTDAYAPTSMRNKVISINKAHNFHSQLSNYDSNTHHHIKRSIHSEVITRNSTTVVGGARINTSFQTTRKVCDNNMTSGGQKLELLSSDEDDDDDVTLLTMTSQTGDDNQEELSSSSSSSRTGSICSVHEVVSNHNYATKITQHSSRVPLLNQTPFELQKVQYIHSHKEPEREATVAEILGAVPAKNSNKTGNDCEDFWKTTRSDNQLLDSDVISDENMPSLMRMSDETQHRRSRSRERMKQSYRSRSQNDMSLSPRRRSSGMFSSTDFRSFSCDGSLSARNSVHSSSHSLADVKSGSRTLSADRNIPRTSSTIDVASELSELISDVFADQENPEISPKSSVSTELISSNSNTSPASTGLSFTWSAPVVQEDGKNRNNEPNVVTKSESPSRYPCVSPRHKKQMKDKTKTRINEILPPGGITIVDNDVTLKNDEKKSLRKTPNSEYKFMSTEDIKKLTCSNPDRSSEGYGATFPQTASKNSKKSDTTNPLIRSKSISIPTYRNGVTRTFSMLRSHKDLSANITPNNILQVSVKNHPKSKEITFSLVSKTTDTKNINQEIDNSKENDKKTYNSTPISSVKYAPEDGACKQRRSSASSTLKRKKNRSKSKRENLMNGGNNSDAPDEEIRVKCRNPLCSEDVNLMEARTRFKSCHHCFTYYCGKKCRLEHWEKHKEKCVYGKINSVCKRAMRVCRDDLHITQAMARVARTGYLSRGSGYVSIIFQRWEDAEDFISDKQLPPSSLPEYYTLTDIQTQLNSDKGLSLGESEELNAINELCEKYYNPNRAYILRIKILVSEKLLKLHKRAYRHKDSNCVSLHVINPLPKPSAIDVNGNMDETLILTPPKTIPNDVTRSGVNSRSSGITSNSSSSPHSSNTDDLKKSRQLSFVNIQRKLRDKGIVLRHQYPDVYAKLCAYVEKDEHFTPSVIYPKDPQSGKNFMCLIMPGSEPQMLGWVKKPGLLDDIDAG